MEQFLSYHSQKNLRLNRRNMKSTILVIDDEEILTKSFARMLEKQGYDVYVASQSEDALAMAEEINFDLILCDIRMPGKNGVETVKQMMETRNAQGKKKIPIIFLTGYADENLEAQARSLNPAAYIFKPFDVGVLLNLIKSQLS